MATFLVTGGCGFIGSHLVDLLVRQGHRVRVLDDLSTGRTHNLAPEAELMIGDVADAAIVTLAMKGVTGCFHLAAAPPEADDLAAHRTSLTGTLTVFEAARGRAVPVVYASSAAVYGDSADQRLSEMAPTKPLSAYGADKLGCELHARIAATTHGVPNAGLRLFNVYGPRQDPASPTAGVISIFRRPRHGWCADAGAWRWRTDARLHLRCRCCCASDGRDGPPAGTPARRAKRRPVPCSMSAPGRPRVFVIWPP
jgi:UDP-glucose 4-epimerase